MTTQTMTPLEQVRQLHIEIGVLCRRFGVRRLEIFGSAATGEYRELSSDVDFLVSYLPSTDLGPWLRDLFALETALAELLGRPVDLVMPKALENPYFRQEADKTRQVIFDSTKVPEVA